MKIYRYYAGKVHELEVRETAKTYIADEPLCAFDYRSRFDKCEVVKSPMEAIKRATTAQESKRSYLKKQIHEVDSDLGQLRRLEKAEFKKNKDSEGVSCQTK